MLAAHTWSKFGLGLLLLGLAVPGNTQPSSTTELPRGEMVEGLQCQTDPSQTYSLYLPSYYEPNRKWPALLIFDPRGRSVAAAELFREAAEDLGWILMSSNDTRSDGPMEPNIKAINALWPEIHLQYPTDYDRIYVTGFSGGAMMAWQLGYLSAEVAGVLAAGGRFEPSNFRERLNFPNFGVVGELDFNFLEMHEVHQQLVRWELDERLEIFPGPHSWMPAPLAREGLEWFELLAMRDGLREPDPERIERWYERGLNAARALEETNQLRAAAARYADLESSFAGLRATSEAAAGSQRLAKAKELKRQRKDFQRWLDFETRFRNRLYDAYNGMRSGAPIWSGAAFARQLGVPELEVQAQKEGAAGVVAQRLLETIFTQTSFYLTRELFGAQEYERAVAVLQVATRIHGDRAIAQYQLACALARTEQKEPALEALERAVAAGFANREWISQDPDLEILRNEARFQALAQEPPGSEAVPTGE